MTGPAFSNQARAEIAFDGQVVGKEAADELAAEILEKLLGATLVRIDLHDGTVALWRNVDGETGRSIEEVGR